MKGTTLHGDKDIRFSDVPEPEIQQPSDAIVRVTLSAICGSDLHLYHGAIPGVLPGTVIGHEYVGIIEAVGDHVRLFKKGDRVVGSFHVACGICPACRRGDFNQCQEGGILGYGLGFGNLQGTQAEYARIPFADVALRRLPQRISDEHALFTGDILTTAYGAVVNAQLRPGETVAVIGCGPVGLMAVQSAVALGAGRVLAIDLLRERTAMAEGMGAIAVTASQVNPINRVNELTGGEGADVVIEAVGGSRTIAMAFDLVRGGGRISAVGVTAEETFPFPLMTSLVKDISFRIGLANIPRHMDATLALVEAGRIDPTIVVSHRMALEDVAEGYRLFDERQATKVLLYP